MPVKRLYWSSRERFREVLKTNFVDAIRVCHVRGHDISIHCSNAIEAYRAGTYESKEPETLDWLDKNLHPNDTYYDVGANIGLYALYAAVCQPKATVLAFEPEATNVSRMMKNIAANQLMNRVTPYNVAVSDKTELGFLHLSQLDAGSALHNFGGGNPLLKAGIFSTSLDDLVQTYGLPVPNLLKVDVDGIEDKIFQGAKGIIENRSLRSVLIEINFDEPSNQNIDRVLREKGFALTLKVPTDHAEKICNCIYLRS